MNKRETKALDQNLSSSWGMEHPGISAFPECSLIEHDSEPSLPIQSDELQISSTSDWLEQPPCEVLASGSETQEDEAATIEELNEIFGELDENPRIRSEVKALLAEYEASLIEFESLVESFLQTADAMAGTRGQQAESFDEDDLEVQQIFSSSPYVWELY